MKHTCGRLRHYIRDAETRNCPRDDDNSGGDYDVEFLAVDLKGFGRENLGPVASPYIMTYVCKRQFLDKQYCMRKDGDIFNIGDSVVLVDQDGDIKIKEKKFRGSEEVWELLTR